jgi:hypothetical protein
MFFLQKRSLKLGFKRFRRLFITNPNPINSPSVYGVPKNDKLTGKSQASPQGTVICG